MLNIFTIGKSVFTVLVKIAKFENSLNGLSGKFEVLLFILGTLFKLTKSLVDMPWNTTNSKSAPIISL